MKLHILGCHGPYPIAGGATSGYLISHGDHTLLMDCGSGVLSKLLSLHDPACLSAILLSHLHFDHASDLLALSYYLQVKGKKLPVYVPPEDESALRGLLSPQVYDVRPYPDEMTLGGILIRTFPVRHPVPCRALRLEADGKIFVFTGDTNTCPGLADFARNAHILMADTAFLECEWKAEGPHLSAQKAAELAKEANAACLLLTHLPVTHDRKTMENEARTVFENARAVIPGEMIEI